MFLRQLLQGVRETPRRMEGRVRSNISWAGAGERTTSTLEPRIRSCRKRKVGMKKTKVISLILIQYNMLYWTVT